MEPEVDKAAPVPDPAPVAETKDAVAVEAAKAEAAKTVNDEIIKVISGHFLEFRKKVSMIFKPEAGVVDDMIVTWQNRYTQQQDPASCVKEGKLNVVIYLKTIPDEKTRTQGYNSFTIDAKMNFTSDVHPAIELEAQAKKKSEEVVAAAEIAASASASTASAGTGAGASASDPTTSVPAASVDASIL